jgi:heptosyltransferase-3
MRRLLIRPGAIGDCIVSLPALEHLRADYTEVWAPSSNLPLIRFADRTRSIASTRLDLLELGQAPAVLLEELGAFEDIVSWYGASRPAFRDAVSRLPFRFFPALPRDAVIHAVDFYLNQVGGRPGAAPRIQVPRFDGGYIAIHPFSGSASKNWPFERFRELAARLQTILRAEIRWTAGPEELLDGAERFADLYELACWLGGARLYIGNDSGITHLAAAAGTPVVALFGPTDPVIWRPRGDRVRIVRGQPLSELSVDEAFRACTAHAGFK